MLAQQIDQLVAEIRQLGPNGFFVLEQALKRLCQQDGIVTIDGDIIYSTAGYLAALEEEADVALNQQLQQSIQLRHLARYREKQERPLATTTISAD